MTPFVIMGPPRSGTTFLCHALNTHPEIFLTNETRMFKWLGKSLSLLDHGDYCFQQNGYFQRLMADLLPGAIKGVSAQAIQCSNKYPSCWGDKNPHYALLEEGEVKALLKAMPNMKWLSLTRDPRDTILSMLKLKWADLPAAIASWKTHIEGAEAIRRLCGKPNFHELKYEHLIFQPRPAFFGILEWLGLGGSPALNAFVEKQDRERIPINGPTRNKEAFQKGYDSKRWVEEFSREELLVILEELGPLMIAKNYETEDSLAQAINETKARKCGVKGRGMKIGLLVIATNKYIKFVQPLWDSVKKYFLANTPHQVTMFVFTDQPNVPEGTVRIQHEHEAWPGPTLHRYHAFVKARDLLLSQDYLFYSDADMLFVDHVGDEILGDLVGTIHPGFWNKPKEQYSYERRPQSRAYMPPGYGEYYFAGGFNGGRSIRFIQMAEEIKVWCEQDEANGIIPVWHDESFLQKFMCGNPPTVRLSPSYCYPESWNLPFPKKLLALDKDHKEIRS